MRYYSGPVASLPAVQHLFGRILLYSVINNISTFGINLHRTDASRIVLFISPAPAQFSVKKGVFYGGYCQGDLQQMAGTAGSRQGSSGNLVRGRTPETRRTPGTFRVLLSDVVLLKAVHVWSNMGDICQTRKTQTSWQHLSTLLTENHPLSSSCEISSRSRRSLKK
jgi:hypothetical protein